ncbi:MAG: DUF4328 domain-containing protein [Cyanobacteriota bacterium]
MTNLIQTDFKDLKNLIKITKITKILLNMQICIAIISAIFYSINIFSYVFLQQELQLPGESLDPKFLVECCIGLFQLLIYIITGILFLVWLYRASRNAHVLDEMGMKYSSGWAVGWYFVPLLCLWKPYCVMAEIWQVSSNPKNWKTATVSPLVSWWWFLWIIGNISGQISMRFSFGEITLENYFISTIFYLISDLSSIPMNIIVIIIISRIYIMQSSYFKNNYSVTSAI